MRQCATTTTTTTTMSDADDARIIALGERVTKLASAKGKSGASAQKGVEDALEVRGWMGYEIVMRSCVCACVRSCARAVLTMVV